MREARTKPPDNPPPGIDVLSKVEEIDQKEYWSDCPCPACRDPERSLRMVYCEGDWHRNCINSGCDDTAIDAAIRLRRRHGQYTRPTGSTGNGQQKPEPEAPPKPAAKSKPTIDYSFRTAADLAAEDITIEWLVDYVLADKQPCVLAGPKKTLKTSIALDLAISLATARPFLGRFRVPQARRVAFMSGESGAATLQETQFRICDAAGIDAASLINLIVSEKLPQIGDLDHYDAMTAAIEENELEVCVVDPAYMAMAAAADGMANLFKVGASLRMLNSLTEETGCSFVLIHHTRKAHPAADQFAPPELEQIAWSGFQEWARQWLLLGRRKAYEPGSGVHDLWLSIGGSAGHGSGWGLTVDEGTRAEGQTRHWAVDLTPAGELVRDEKQAKAQAKDAERNKAIEANALAILQYIRREGRVLQASARKNVVDGRPFFTAWQWLVESEQIRKVGTMKAGNGQPREAWEVADE